MIPNIVEELQEENTGPCSDRQSGCSAVAVWLLQRIGPVKVIEIGTSYGRQLPTFVPHASHVVCVDPMYEWVPDIRESHGFEPGQVSQAKVDAWRQNVEPWKERVELVIGNSYQAHGDPAYSASFAGTSLLIIDGCHHPADLVAKDYENFRRFMTTPHYVIWDDIGMPDVQGAADRFPGPHKDLFGARLCFF